MAKKKRLIVFVVIGLAISITVLVVGGAVRSGLRNSKRSLIMTDSMTGQEKDLYDHPWYYLAWEFFKQRIYF